MSDCYAMISSIFASYGRIVDAIEAINFEYLKSLICYLL